PYLQIGLVGLFILLGFIGFSVIRNSEKRHIWAGMARETAHQLGTPVSALFGWVDLLKNNPDRTKSIVKDMDIDLARLQEISSRFSDMGTVPKFEKLDLIELIVSTGIVDYEGCSDLDGCDIHLHEYECYEDAYKVATDMREGNPLCYS
ncbi:MAG: HAMP domain-containing histidine kinase, partial [Candidatus Marinimicrobia bacterium]|nr:HAMP domain-containing histidine kinase [Candidatus Neomarinimicrobiota bacterium]